MPGRFWRIRRPIIASNIDGRKGVRSSAHRVSDHRHVARHVDRGKASRSPPNTPPTAITTMLDAPLLAPVSNANSVNQLTRGIPIRIAKPPANPVLGSRAPVGRTTSQANKPPPSRVGVSRKVTRNGPLQDYLHFVQTALEYSAALSRPRGNIQRFPKGCSEGPTPVPDPDHSVSRST